MSKINKFETVYYDEDRFRYTIDLDLLDLNPTTGQVNIKNVIRVLQDYRNSWSHLKTFMNARSTTDLFKLAYVNYLNMTQYKTYVAYLQSRIVVDLYGRLAYFYADGKMPASEADAKEYCGPTIYNPIPTFTITEPNAFNVFSRIVIAYPTERMLSVNISTDHGSFKAPFIIPSNEQRIVFSGSIATINSELQKVLFVPGNDTANIIISVDDNVGIVGSVSSTTLRVSGHDEPLTPTLDLISTNNSMLATMDYLSLTNFIEFSGVMPDIATMKVSTNNADIELTIDNGIELVTKDVPYIGSSGTLGSSLKDIMLKMNRTGINENKTMITVELTLNESHESEIINSSMEILQMSVPKPTVIMVPETHTFGTSRDMQRLTGVVKFTGKISDVSEVKFISHYYNAQLVSSAGNVIAKEYVPEIVLEESKWGTLTDLDINIIRNGAGDANEPISIQYTLSEIWNNEVITATLQVAQEDYGIPSVTQKSEITIAGDQDTVEFLASDLFELHNITGDADVPYITYSSNEFIVDVFYNDTQFLRVQPGDSQIFGGDQTYEMISGGKIRIHRLNDENKSGSFNIAITIGYTKHDSVINFNQEAKVSSETP